MGHASAAILGTRRTHGLFLFWKSGSYEMGYSSATIPWDEKHPWLGLVNGCDECVVLCDFGIVVES